MDVVRETNLGIGKLRRGKVRDCYQLDGHLLLVATDRISAFDVVMPNGIPYKGKVLSSLSKFWFDKTSHIVDNHVVTTEVEQIVERIPELAGKEDSLAAGRLLAGLPNRSRSNAWYGDTSQAVPGLNTWKKVQWLKPRCRRVCYALRNSTPRSLPRRQRQKADTMRTSRSAG